MTMFLADDRFARRFGGKPFAAAEAERADPFEADEWWREDAGFAAAAPDPTAWDELTAAAYGAGQFVDNFTADQEAEAEAYRQRIAAVHAATGVQLEDPLRFPEHPDYKDFYGRFGGDVGKWGAWQKQLFAGRLQELATQFPQHSGQILGEGDMTAQQLAITRAANERFEAALADPQLGTFGRVTGTLAGYLGASVRDPLQVFTAFAGGSAGTGRTVIARLAQVMAYEAAINAGVETALQVKNFQYRRRAGIDYTVRDAATNIGVSAIFGAGIGGGLQGLREMIGGISRSTGRELSAGGVAALERTLGGNALAEDADLLQGELAEFFGRELAADEIGLVRRAVEEDALDEDYLRQAGDAFGLDDPDANYQLAQAAMRHAEDPERYLPPELVAEGLARRDETGGGSLTAEDYIREYELGEAIDPLAEAKDRAAARLAVEGTPDAETDPLAGRSIAPPEPAEPATEESFKKALRAAGLEPADDALTPDADASAARARPDRPDASSASGADGDGEAEIRFPDPELDEKGNVKSTFDLLPDADDEGRPVLRTANEALERASAGDGFAEILEACKL